MVKTFEELNERHREKMRGLQAPLTHAEKEQIELAAAKQRWERNKKLEKDAMERREREQRERHRRRRSDADDLKKLSVSDPSQLERRRHSRSMSQDRLGMGGGEPSSRRMSMLKVEDWQRYQQGEPMPRSASAGATRTMMESPTSMSGGRRMSIGDAMDRSTSVPFPADGRRKNSRTYLS